LKVLSTELL